ncbi:MAG: ATP synthase subunit I [Candidatus Aminicenantales bacterium]
MTGQATKKVNTSIEEAILKRIPWEIILLSFIVSLLSLLIFEPLTAVFILGGGLLSTLNFIWLRQSITHLLSPGRRKKKLLSVLIPYSLRLILIIIVFFIIIFFFSRKIWAVIVGFSTILLVIGAEAGALFFKARNE